MKTEKDGSVLVVLFLTERCNLNCGYCYVRQSPQTMSWPVARQAVDFVAGLPQEKKTICFMGGEPLLEWDLLKKTTAYAKSRGISGFNLCTNLLLLNRQKLDFFRRNNFNLMLSLDGVPEAHDAERRDHSGAGSFSRVSKSIALVSGGAGLKYTIQMSIAPSNVKHLAASFAYFMERGIADTSIYLVPIVNYDWNARALAVFEKEVVELAKLHKENKARLPGCRLVFGKCCSPFAPEALRATKAARQELCLCENRYYGVDAAGGVYYCFFGGFSKYRKQAGDYKLGDVWSGLTESGKLKEFTGKGMKRSMSCLAWNYIVNKDVAKPAEAHRELYGIWLKNA